jgi:hypothetical protein
MKEDLVVATKCFVAISLAIALATLASAQEPPTPDFSGKWMLALARSKLVKGSPIVLETLAIACSGQTTQFHYTTTRRDFTHTFITDNQEHPVAQYQSGADIAKTTWKKSGGVVVLVVQSKSPNMPALPETTGHFHETDIWTLSTDGRVLTEKSSGTYGASEIYVYDKR